MSATLPLLELDNLCVSYRTDHGQVRAVDHVDLCIQPGESVAIVGESGCGKSSLALALLRLLGEHQACLSGAVRFADRDLLQLPTRALQDIRGREIAMVFQDPMTSLNPYLRIGLQVAEPMRRHLGYGQNEARDHAIRLLHAVGIADPETRLECYPHEFSGGMRQRAMIAAALSCEPKLLIADEPTTALDVTIQAQILERLREQMQKRDMALLIITHDLGVVAGLCDRVAIMYAGQIVETGEAEAIYARPCHPYTQALLRSVPRPDADNDARLVSIPGQPPTLMESVSACAFSPRCAHVQPRCREEAPPLRQDGRGRIHRCFFELEPDQAKPVAHSRAGAASVAATPILEVQDLHVRFRVRGGPLDQVRDVVHAVKGVSLALNQGEVLGLVGESGCGKSTLVRAILQLVRPDSGAVRLAGQDLTSLHGRALRLVGRYMQIIFQDPYASLNPRLQAQDIIAEPLRNFGLCGTREARQRARALMETVGLHAAWARRYPHEFSGGQRQRLGIARALAVEPQVLLCDEPVSALDVSVQADIINLLRDLQSRLHLAMIFISHDLAVVRHLANRVAIMHDGEIVERGDAKQIYTQPQHAYTRKLLSAIPIPDPRVERERLRA